MGRRPLLASAGFCGGGSAYGRGNRTEGTYVDGRRLGGDIVDVVTDAEIRGAGGVGSANGSIYGLRLYFGLC